MNRRQKIIISVTGIFLVMLILLGLTYAYYLTRITGNTKDKSISIETANLKIEYSESDNTIIDNGGKPFIPSKEKTEATKIGEKYFTVTNNGDETVDYFIVIEDVVITDTITGEKTTFESNDFYYELFCTVYASDIPGISEGDGTLPLSDSWLDKSRVAPGKTNACTLSVWYLDNGKDQSNDMHKNITARINIVDPREYNPYEDKENSLAYNIVNNAINVTNDEINKNYAAYRRTPLTEPGKELSLEMESSLSQAPDDYTELTGFNSFYFRGNVENNYVEFNNMCFRIVRVEGDGSVKLILAKDGLCSSIDEEKDMDSAFIGTGDYGFYIQLNQNGLYDTFANYEESENENESLKGKFDEWLNGTLSDGVTKRFSESSKAKIKTTKICVGDRTTMYDDEGNVYPNSGNYYSYVRLKYKESPSLICEENGQSKNEYKIYPITKDETVFAGEKGEEANSTFYLRDNSVGKSPYIYDSAWWTLTPKYFGIMPLEDIIIGETDFSYTVRTNYGLENGDDVESNNYLRPSISLIPGIELTSDSGNGTKSSPYKVKID